MSKFGWVLVSIGILCIVLSITMDTAVSTGLGGKVNNLGLMNQQTNLLLGGGISFISGILLIGFGSKSKVSTTGKVRICPYCAEQVKVQAVICRFCQKDLPLAESNGLNQPTKKGMSPKSKKKTGLLVLFFMILVFSLASYFIRPHRSSAEQSITRSRNVIASYCLTKLPGSITGNLKDTCKEYEGYSHPEVDKYIRNYCLKHNPLNTPSKKFNPICKKPKYVPSPEDISQWNNEEDILHGCEESPTMPTCRIPMVERIKIKHRQAPRFY